MAKQGFDKLIDSIDNRENDDPMGMRGKKKGDEQSPKKKIGGGIDGMLDAIRDRDFDDPTGTKSKKKESSEPEKQEKKRSKGGIDGMLDAIRDRDDDDPTGTKKKSKPRKDDDENPLDETLKDTTKIVGAGIGAVAGMGVIKGLSGMINQK